MKPAGPVSFYRLPQDVALRIELEFLVDGCHGLYGSSLFLSTLR